MLTVKEYERLIEFYKENKKLTTDQMINFIEENFVNKSPIQNAYKKADPKDFINKTRPNGDPSDPFDINETRKKEKKTGFKIRTPGESMKADKNNPAAQQNNG